MANEEPLPKEETQLIELLETFLQTDTEEAIHLIEQHKDALLSDTAVTLLQNQIGELTDILDTLKQKLCFLEDIQPHWERMQQQTQAQYTTIPEQELFIPEQKYIPLEDAQVEQLQQQISHDQLAGIIERLQSMSDDEQTRFIEAIGQAEQFNDAQKQLFKQALQQMKHWSNDKVMNLAGTVKSMPFDQFKGTAQAFSKATSAIDISSLTEIPKHAINDANSALAQDISSAQAALAALERAGTYMVSTTGDQAQNPELAIADFNTALKFFKRETMPLQWAAAMSGRGLAYIDREVGDRQKNVQQAFDDLDAALTVPSREQVPEGWASVKLGRARAALLLAISKGDRGAILNQVIQDCDDALEVLASDSSSDACAHALQTRAIAYAQRNTGNGVQNIEQAIADVNTALKIFTRERMPPDWAQLHLTRGNAYFRRYMGSREKNLEQAISDHNTALSVYTKTAYPDEWAQTLSNRNMASQELNAGSNRQSIEQLLAEYDAVFAVLSPQKMPIEWASAHINCGNIYINTLAPIERHKNFEQALKHFNLALEVLSPTNAPLLWAQVHINIGIVQRSLLPQNLLVAAWSGGGYVEGLGQGLNNFRGEIEQTLHTIEESIASFTLALSVLTKEIAPFEWAVAHRERAVAYSIDTLRDRKPRLLQALADYDDALTVHTRKSNPREWAMLHHNRALIFLAHVVEDPQKDSKHALQDLDAALTVYTPESMPANYRRAQFLRSLILERLGNWEEAHEALLKARQLQRDLVAAAPDERNRSDLITSLASADMYLRDAQILLRLAKPDLAEVAIALEEGRAQSLRVALDLDSIDPKKARTDSARQRATTFLVARNLWRKRQHEMLNSSPSSDNPIAAYEHQKQGRENLQVAYEGFLQARTAIRQHDNPDFMTPVPTLEGIAGCISTVGEALVYLAAGSYISMGGGTPELADTLIDGMEGGMAIIVTRAIDGKPQVQHLALPRLTSSAISLLINTNTQLANQNTLLPIFLEQAVQTLGELGLNDLVAELARAAVRKVTIVAYGRINLFPLPAVRVRRPEGNISYMGDMFEIIFAPSARAAESAQQRMVERTKQRITKEHPAMLVAGDPQPSVAPALPFAEAEAATIHKIALAHGYPAAHIHYLKPDEVTKAKVVATLTKVRDAYLAVHGEYVIDKPRLSRLILAGNRLVPERDRIISLDEALNGSIDLSSMRLLVLSSCKTSLSDMRAVPNEVMGLSAGFLQAGAACVIASLWSVDDQATYFLMTRFAQLYLDPQGTWSPARALTEAQRWLREEATNRVLATYDPLQSFLSPLLPEETSARNFSTGTTKNQMHKPAREQLDTAPDALPYADPRYWAAFVVTGC